MWISFAGAVLLVATFLWLMLQLWRESRAVGSELSIHRRERLSRRLQSLVLGIAGVATAAFALHGAFVLQALDQRLQAHAARKPVLLQFDSQLRFVPPEPPALVIDGIALAETVR
jgi:hypothetical protein